MSGQGSSPDEHLSPGCNLRESRDNNDSNHSLRSNPSAAAAAAPAAGISSSGEQQQIRHSSSERQDEYVASGSSPRPESNRERTSTTTNNNTVSSSGGNSSSEHAADFFHNYYSNRGYALDNNKDIFSGSDNAEENVLKSLKSNDTTQRQIYGELTVYSWGRGEDGQLGIGDTSDQDEPTYVDALRGVGVKEIACGSGHTVVLTGEGEVYTWLVSFYIYLVLICV